VTALLAQCRYLFVANYRKSRGYAGRKIATECFQTGSRNIQ
jgi:hypothetical protein